MPSEVKNIEHYKFDSGIPENYQEQTGHLKWFNFANSYGFITCEDGKDAFLLGKVIQDYGMTIISDGAKIKFHAVERPKGRFAIKITDVIEMEPEPKIKMAENVIHGTIKWFDTDKGYGFVEPENGGKPVFFHRSILTQENYAKIEQGARVIAAASDGKKGLEIKALKIS